MGILDWATLWPLFQTVFSSILEVFLVCSAGYFLASKGILDKKTQKQLNRLNVSLLTPSLLFSKVAFFLNPNKLKELWIIPILFVVVVSLYVQFPSNQALSSENTLRQGLAETLTSMGVAYSLSTLFRLKRSQRNFSMAASMFMNSNSLPLALMQSLVVSQTSTFRWGDDDNKNTMLGRALTYLVLYSTMGMVLRWSYGVRLLSQADEIEPSAIDAADSENTPLLAHTEEEEGFLPHTTGSKNTLSDEPEDMRSSPYQTRIEEHRESSFFPSTVAQDTDRLAPPPSRRMPPPRRRTSHFYRSFPNSPNQSTSRLPSMANTPSNASNSSSEEEETDDEDGQLPAMSRRRSVVTPSSTRMQSFFRQTKHRLGKWWTGFNEFMTVPLWAALASLIVACIAPLQHTLDVHMPPVKGALASAGNCSIPLTLLVLGSFFYSPKEDISGPEASEGHTRVASMTKSSTTSLIHSVREMFHIQQSRRAPATRAYSTGGTLLAASYQKSRPGETKTVAIAVLSRMILTPMILLPLMALAAKLDMHKILDDPVFIVSNVLLIASPPALTLAQITQAASGDSFERLISRTIFWSYCILTPPSVIIYVIFGLMLSKL